MLVASANPEDYTNRGRIITPLKDRFGSQIRTHYPLDVETEVAIARQEARPFVVDGVRVDVPEFMAEIVATLTHLARESPHVNQRSGVSVRLTVANKEMLVANATRRALRHGETDVVPRISDLDALAASTSGKVEIETLEEGRDGQIIDQLLRGAVLTVFRETFDLGELSRSSTPSRSAAVEVGEDMARPPTSSWPPSCRPCGGREPPHRGRVDRPAWPPPSSSSSRACTCPSACNKEAAGGRATYRAVGLGSVATPRCPRRMRDDPGSATRAGTAPRSASSSTPTT